MGGGSCLSVAENKCPISLRPHGPIGLLCSKSFPFTLKLGEWPHLSCRLGGMPVPFFPPHLSHPLLTGLHPLSPGTLSGCPFSPVMGQRTWEAQ